MRRAFGNSLQRFSRELSSLQRIGFQRVAIVARDKAGVTVDIRSVATHVNRVDRCTGRVGHVAGGARVTQHAGVHLPQDLDQVPGRPSDFEGLTARHDEAAVQDERCFDVGAADVPAEDRRHLGLRLWNGASDWRSGSQ